ncbi:type II toxin-antitoxin system PemK/MazF family toxin [Brevundimonas aveniformis]|uniref:type II toxin-antitoxin system PemK/MazF family toxin n=1 Tax=Brevundimonas aveniformis TaxID=370977 RepID=UPI0024915356|nr:type II toxin-antitoxin system PemK/MazF family toxin [Brevundimonas aveniformis]
MSFERGDLLLIPFPFTDLTATKQRPVLALTAPDARGDFIGLPVTSREQDAPALPPTDADLAHGALPRASWIRVDHPVTLHAGLARKTVARLRAETVDEAVKRLCAVLGRG